jgi:very-short-patch-repair endonuclease
MRQRNAKARVARIADRQWGRVSWAQLLAVGLDEKTVWRWAQAGYLHWILPRVYAVGHQAPSTEADLAAALLYAGPGAMLSHATAAWWWGLIDEQPKTISVSTPRRCKSLKGVEVHGRRSVERVWHKGLSVTLVAQTLLDYATVCTLRRLRRAIAEADYQRLATPAELEAVLATGRAGSAKLRQAIAIHQPRLARTRSLLEELFLELCERHELPVPSVNVTVEGFLVDAFWQQHRLVIEVDGHRAHATPARMKRDRERDLALRRAGYTVQRYSWWQVTDQAELVAADVRAALIAR